MAFARPIIVPAIGPSRIQTAAVSIMQIITGQSELIWISLGLILGFGRYFAKESDMELKDIGPPSAFTSADIDRNIDGNFS